MSAKTEEIRKFIHKLEKELFENIVPFWLNKTKDDQNGGFHGRITNDLIIEKDAPKSLILHTRVLWAFSFLYGFRKEKEYLEIAQWAYDFIINKFMDKKYGGVFWMVDVYGNVLESNKKMYGQAFFIYAFAEYYKVTKNKEVLELAIDLFNLIEKNNYDKKNKGYYEASKRNWKIDRSISLSPVDMTEVKSMNTHMHLMEAYTTLYTVWPDSQLKFKLTELINDHLDYIIDAQSKHFNLFFDEKWESKSRNVSFGHDIEGSWLLCEAAYIAGDKALIKKVEKIALQMVDVTIQQAFDKKNAIYAEKEGDGTLRTQLEWWQQVEAMVGFVNAFQITKDEIYMDWAIRMWDVIEKFIIDHDCGEWFFRVDANGDYDSTKQKVSEWKGPYHNIRACVEVLKRLKVNSL